MTSVQGADGKHLEEQHEAGFVSKGTKRDPAFHQIVPESQSDQGRGVGAEVTSQPHTGTMQWKLRTPCWHVRAPSV